jgi:hypothetical protein
MADTMQVRLKANPSAEPTTIEKTAFDAQLHTEVNPADIGKVAGGVTRDSFKAEPQPIRKAG